MDGMDARVIRLEERTDLFARQFEKIDGRFDRMEARLGAIDERLVTMGREIARLPSKEFLVGWMLGVFAAALAVSALTFQIADYAAKQAVPESRATAPAAPQQPTVIVLPLQAMVPQAGAPPAVQPAPAAPELPKP